jgi:hypothetical protein
MTPVFARIRPVFQSLVCVELHVTVTPRTPASSLKKEHKETDSIYAIGSSYD